MKTKILLLLALNLVWVLPLSGQGSVAVDFYKSAEQALLQRKYKKAIRMFEKALDRQPDMLAAKRGIGACYELLNEYEKALEYYLEVQQADYRYSRNLYYQIGNAFYKTGQYDKAIAYFKQFETLRPLSKYEFKVFGEEEIKQTEDFYLDLPVSIRGAEISKDSSMFREGVVVRNLGKGVNSKAEEYFPFLANDQSWMYFTSRKDALSDENLYLARKRNGKWQSAGGVKGQFNSSLNEGMATVVRDGRHLYFTACNRPEVEGPCDIWEATVRDDKIEDLRSLSGQSNSENWESQAAISCDGGTLYFASNRPGGEGGTDIWYSKLQSDGSWSAPINMGPKINTPKDEESPFITNDGRTLYFCSTGHLGMGDQDIFMSLLEFGDQWSSPVNLGPEVNTPYRELGFFLSADGKTGYFASDRPGGQGGMDIYEVELGESLYSEPMTFVEGYLLNAYDQKRVAGLLRIQGRGGRATEPDGRFFLCVRAGDSLRISVEQEGFHPYTETFYILERDNKSFFNIELLLIPVDVSLDEPEPVVEEEAAEPGPQRRIRQPRSYQHVIYFPFNSSEIEFEEFNELDDFITLHAEKNIQRIELSGYADPVGEAQLNLLLSEQRAKNLTIYLMDKGFVPERIFLQGNGELFNEASDQEKRKVVLKIYTLE